jgi:hypothetical protein
MRHLGGDQWALHVPLGKLHNERWVPMDDDARKTFQRILSLAGPATTDPANPTPPPYSCSRTERPCITPRYIKHFKMPRKGPVVRPFGLTN